MRQKNKYANAPNIFKIAPFIALLLRVRTKSIPVLAPKARHALGNSAALDKIHVGIKLANVLVKHSIKHHH